MFYFFNSNVVIHVWKSSMLYAFMYIKLNFKILNKSIGSRVLYLPKIGTM